MIENTFDAALSLHRYIRTNHCEHFALVGPDVGIRFNARVGRFFKSFFPGLPWSDQYRYLQAQGYWVLANWFLFQATGESFYRQIAIGCSQWILKMQRSDGAWNYPNPEWKGRIATAECTWAALGLIETYRNTADSEVLSGVLKWNDFLINQVGFDRIDDELAINYFAGRQRARVPNNSAFVLRFFAELAEVRADVAYLAPCAGLMKFMTGAQKPTGEFPYMVKGTLSGGRCWPHFECYQYNAFQCLDLMRYYQVTSEPSARALIGRCLAFLSGGVTDSGESLYDCTNPYRHVTYHTGALGAALRSARRFGFEDYDELADRAFSFLLRNQHKSGSFPYSHGDYRVLHDHRSYPRALSMILFHLLTDASTSELGN